MYLLSVKLTVNKAKIKAKNIEIIIPFENENELIQKLNELDVEKIIKVLEDKFGSLISEARQPKAGLESIYRFTREGDVELLKVPNSEPKTLALVMYAYHPESASIEQLSKSCGVATTSIQKYISHKDYKDYFDRKPDGKYTLTHAGLKWVTTKVIPELKHETVKGE